MTEPTKRKYNKIAPDHLAYAKRRFVEFASTSAVRAELKAMGGDYPHNALAYYWKQAEAARHLASGPHDHDHMERLKSLERLTAIDQEIANGDPGDEAQGGGC